MTTTLATVVCPVTNPDNNFASCLFTQLVANTLWPNLCAYQIYNHTFVSEFDTVIHSPPQRVSRLAAEGFTSPILVLACDSIHQCRSEAQGWVRFWWLVCWPSGILYASCQTYSFLSLLTVSNKPEGSAVRLLESIYLEMVKTEIYFSIAGNFCQRKISSKVAVTQFVTYFFS